MTTLTEYITRRLGESTQEQARNFLAKPFGAASFTEFWQYWNPVWGYFLRYYCYRPLRKYLPRAIAVFLTFLICGLVHDLPIALLAYIVAGKAPLFTLTIFFALIGGLMIFTEAIRLRFTAVPVAFRWIIHGFALVACYQAALYLTMR